MQRFIWTPLEATNPDVFSCGVHVMTIYCHLLDPRSPQAPSSSSISTVVGQKYKLAPIVAEKLALRQPRGLKLKG